jgi:thiopurine S-methyltransferase
MKVKESDSNYWNKRYIESNTGWDIGYANPVLVEYVKENYSFDDKILIPGAGTAYEVADLISEGYHNCYALDFSQKAKDNFLKQNPKVPNQNYLVNDFFEIDGKYDLILEQTFFCAIHPSKRVDYVHHMSQLLNKGGKLAGLLFEMEKEDGPPYGGSLEEYQELFSSSFDINKLGKTDRSIDSRLGRELFFEFIKK